MVKYIACWIGELGWELFYFQPHLRWLKKQYPEVDFIVYGYPDRGILYKDFVKEFKPLPGFFLKDKPDCSCSVLYKDNEKYLMDKLKLFIVTEHPGADFLFPWETFSIDWRKQESEFSCKRNFIPLTSSHKEKNKLVDIVLFPRYRQLTSYKNWSLAGWTFLAKKLSEKYKVVVCGKEGQVRQIPGIDTMEQDMDSTIFLLQNALCSITSHSGTLVLSMLCNTPTFSFGKDDHIDGDKYFKDRFDTCNVFKSKAEFLNSGWYPDPRIITAEVYKFIEGLQ